MWATRGRQDIPDPHSTLLANYAVHSENVLRFEASLNPSREQSGRRKQSREGSESWLGTAQEWFLEGLGGEAQVRKIRAEEEKTGRVTKSVDFGRMQPQLHCLLHHSIELVWAHPIMLLSSGILFYFPSIRFTHLQYLFHSIIVKFKMK